MDYFVASLLATTRERCVASDERTILAYPPNSKPRLHAFSVTADPRMKTICSSVRVEKNVMMLVM